MHDRCQLATPCSARCLRSRFESRQFSDMSSLTGAPRGRSDFRNLSDYSRGRACQVSGFSPCSGWHRRCCLRFARALAGAMRRRGGPDFGYRVCNDLSAPLVYSPWSHVNSRRVCVCQQTHAINLRADGKQTDHKFDLAVQTLAIATSLMRGRVNAGRPGKTVAKSSGISICMEPRQ
ncbi:hypothetical protein J2793_007109 [Paraburkholderia caledonica]|uniref:Uncharacterized protein n=1 Tax=Paraburkholderia caledonica TaxID=134536 RepID=A0AB73INT1_9BURK|nr:hypothetical protein [Paraburkholderia caledonica]